MTHARLPDTRGPVQTCLVAVVLGIGLLEPSRLGTSASEEPVLVASPGPAAGQATSGPTGRLGTAAARQPGDTREPFTPQTRVSLREGLWQINGEMTYRGIRARGLLMNVRMVNSVFEDRRKPGFDAAANTDCFLDQIADYVAHGVRAFTIGLQGVMPGYEGALNSAFAPDGSLHESYLARVRRVIEACDWHSLVVILGCFDQRQDQVLADETAVRAGVVNVARWIQRSGFRNVVLEIANEIGHPGFDHPLLRSADGEAALVRLAKQTIPADAQSKPGSGGQLIAFVPSRDLVVTRQTGGSGDWLFEEFLHRACQAVLDAP